MTGALIVLAVMSALVAVAYLAKQAVVEATLIREQARLEAVKVERARADYDAREVAETTAREVCEGLVKRLDAVEGSVSSIKANLSIARR